MKGIILAGGAGTRLHPITLAVSKQLLPVYDKPMIYYPLSVLMLEGIRDILIISTPQDLPSFQRLFGDGQAFGLRMKYVEQPRPDGLAQAFILGKDYLGGDRAALVLGDNLFYGHGFPQSVNTARQLLPLGRGASIFGYQVKDPERYGVVTFDGNGRAYSLEEKPANSKSNWAVPGLYFYDESVCERAAKLKPSARGELEITDLNRLYLDDGMLHVEKIGRGVAWLDTGTHRSLQDASAFVQAIEERQGLKIACLEEIAFHYGWIDEKQVSKAAETLGKSAYGEHLRSLIK